MLRKKLKSRRYITIISDGDGKRRKGFSKLFPAQY